jgi:hypothetical protein
MNTTTKEDTTPTSIAFTTEFITTIKTYEQNYKKIFKKFHKKIDRLKQSIQTHNVSVVYIKNKMTQYENELIIDVDLLYKELIVPYMHNIPLKSIKNIKNDFEIDASCGGCLYNL